MHQYGEGVLYFLNSKQGYHDSKTCKTSVVYIGQKHINTWIASGKANFTREFYCPFKIDRKYPKEITHSLFQQVSHQVNSRLTPQRSLDRMVPKEQLYASLNMIEYIFKSSIITDMYNNYYIFVTLIATHCQHCFSFVFLNKNFNK